MGAAAALAAGDANDFNRAAAALQKAVGDGDEKTEAFWRQVFDGYVRVVVKRSIGDTEEFDNFQTAGMFFYGIDPIPSEDNDRRICKGALCGISGTAHSAVESKNSCRDGR